LHQPLESPWWTLTANPKEPLRRPQIRSTMTI
jgi:hypothetical protein